MLNSRFIALVLCVLTLTVFAPALAHEFVNWDDDVFLYESLRLNPPSLGKVMDSFSESNRGLYMPLTFTAWSGLAGLSHIYPDSTGTYPLNPTLFHAASLLVHLLSVITVFGILRSILSNGFRKAGTEVEARDPDRIALAAGMGALLFAIHPVQVEPVVWASELKDLLCGLFSFLAIRAYLAFAFASGAEAADRTRRRDYGLACGAFLLALLAKPAAVVLPVVLLMLDRWVAGRSLLKSVRSLAGWFAVAALFAMIARTVQQHGALTIETAILARPLIAGDALAFYLSKIVLPLEIGIDYGRTPTVVLNQWWGYATWLVPVGLAIVIYRTRQRVVWAVCFGLFVTALLPVLGFVPFQFQFYSTVADHYLYLSMLGVALALSWAVLSQERMTLAAGVGVVLVLFLVRSAFLVPIWQNEMALYRNALAVNPRSFLSHNNMGRSERARGRIVAAEYQFAEALKIWSGYPDANVNLGIALGHRGDLDTSITLYQRALDVWPNHQRANLNMGVALTQQGKTTDAIGYLEKALRLQPGDALAHSNLGAAHAYRGDFDRAIAHFTEALRINPGLEQTRKLLELAREQAQRD